MKRLFNNKLFILLLCLIAIFLMSRRENTQTIQVTAKQPTKENNKNTYTEIINPNPAQRLNLKNPFKQVVASPLLSTTSSKSGLLLTGIVSKNDEFIAIISVQGKSDFYTLHQKILGHSIREINSTSVVLYDEQTKEQLILHIKE